MTLPNIGIKLSMIMSILVVMLFSEVRAELPPATITRDSDF